MRFCVGVRGEGRTLRRGERGIAIDENTRQNRMRKKKGDKKRAQGKYPIGVFANGKGQ